MKLTDKKAWPQLLFWSCTILLGLLILSVGIGLSYLVPQVGKVLGALFFIAILSIPGWYAFICLHDHFLGDDT